jgi:hypothetical protein
MRPRGNKTAIIVGIDFQDRGNPENEINALLKRE